MFCQECQKRPATIHMTRIVNNVKTEVHLCSECARKHQKLALSMSFEPSFSIHKFQAVGWVSLPNGACSLLNALEGLDFGKFGETGGLAAAVATIPLVMG